MYTKLPYRLNDESTELISETDIKQRFRSEMEAKNFSLGTQTPTMMKVKAKEPQENKERSRQVNESMSSQSISTENNGYERHQRYHNRETHQQQDESMSTQPEKKIVSSYGTHRELQDELVNRTTRRVDTVNKCRTTGGSIPTTNRRVEELLGRNQ